MNYFRRKVVLKALLLTLSVASIVVFPSIVAYADEEIPLPDPGEPGGF